MDHGSTSTTAFHPISMEAIKSISQRALACYWTRLKGRDLLPDFSKFKPESRTHDPAQLVAWNIEGDDNNRRFRSLFQGNNVLEVFNSAWSGKTMDQVVPGFLKSVSVEAAHECASTGCMVYSIISTTDEEGHRVDCERLLLPFGRSKTEQILSSLQLISIEGNFQRRAVLSRFARETHIVLAGKISQQSRHGSPPSEENVGGLRTRAHQEQTSSSSIANKRRKRRVPLRKSARIVLRDSAVTCLVSDISADGARLHLSQAHDVPESFLLTLELEMTERLCRRAWQRDDQVGVTFAPRKLTRSC